MNLSTNCSRTCDRFAFLQTFPQTLVHRCHTCYLLFCHSLLHRLTKCNDYSDTRITSDRDHCGTHSSSVLADYECSFRGYPLQGKKVTVPVGYKGMVFMEKKRKTDPEGKKRNLHCTGTFSQFTYWNYDRIPSENDAFSAALDWIDIADAVSSFSVNTCTLPITSNPGSSMVR